MHGSHVRRHVSRSLIVLAFTLAQAFAVSGCSSDDASPTAVAPETDASTTASEREQAGESVNGVVVLTCPAPGETGSSDSELTITVYDPDDGELRFSRSFDRGDPNDHLLFPCGLRKPGEDQIRARQQFDAMFQRVAMEVDQDADDFVGWVTPAGERTITGPTKSDFAGSAKWGDPFFDPETDKLTFVNATDGSLLRFDGDASGNGPTTKVGDAGGDYDDPVVRLPGGNLVEKGTAGVVSPTGVRFEGGGLGSCLASGCIEFAVRDAEGEEIATIDPTGESCYPLFALSDKRIVCYPGPNKRDNLVLTTVDLSANSARGRLMLPRTDRAIGTPVGNPERTKIAFVSSLGDSDIGLFTVSLNPGEEPTRLADVPPGSEVLDWVASDGKSTFFAGPERAVRETSRGKRSTTGDSPAPTSTATRRPPRRSTRGDDWPGGRAYTVILGSSSSESAARALQRRASNAGLDAGMLFSSDYRSLRPGYWVTFSGTFPSSSAAGERQVRARSQGFADAYVRFVSPS